MRCLDSVVQRHYDEQVIRYRRCSEGQRAAQPWVCQWLVSHPPTRTIRIPAAHHHAGALSSGDSGRYLREGAL
jgi:hypothetical protein